MARKPKETTDTKHLYKRGTVWYVVRMENGKRLIQSTGATTLDKAIEYRNKVLTPYALRDEKERAEAVLSRVAGIDQRLAKIKDEEPSTTIKAGWQAYLDQHNRPDSGESTLRQYEFQYEAFARWYKDNYPEQLDSESKPIAWELRHVTQEQADRYAGHLQKEVSASTFNRHMNLLALVWRILEKTARISENPWKQIGRKKFTVQSRRELTVEELGKVIDAAQGEMRVLLALGIYCGLRLGDAACLEWSNVDMVKGSISLIPMKTARRSHKRVTLPIHRTLYAILEEIPAELRKGYVLPDTAAAYANRRDSVCAEVKKLFAAADIRANAKTITASERAAMEQAKREGNALPPPKRSKGRASAECGFHSLRHTFVSLCAAGNVNLSTVQSLVGHGSPAMTRHYAHIDFTTAQNAVDTLPDITPAEARPESADAAGAKLATVLAMLEGLSPTERESVAKKLKALKKALKAQEAGR